MEEIKNPRIIVKFYFLEVNLILNLERTSKGKSFQTHTKDIKLNVHI